MAEDTTDPQDAMSTGTNPTPAMGTTTETDAISGTPQTESLDAIKKELDALRAALKKANTDAKGHRLKNEELEKFKEQIEAAQLSDKEKQDLAAKKLQEQLATLQKERDDAISRHQEERLNHAIQLQAIKQGLNPEAATRLLDKAALEFDEAGNPTNLDKAFTAMVKQFDLKPVAGVPTSGGATNPPHSQSNIKPLSHETIARMTREEYLARQAEIIQWKLDNPPAR